MDIEWLNGDRQLRLEIRKEISQVPADRRLEAMKELERRLVWAIHSSRLKAGIVVNLMGAFVNFSIPITDAAQRRQLMRLAMGATSGWKSYVEEL